MYIKKIDHQQRQSEVFYKKMYSQKFCKINTKKHTRRSLFLNKVTGPRLQDGCFPVNFVNFSKTPQHL